MLGIIVFSHQPYLCFYGKALCVGVFLGAMAKKTVQHHFFAFTQVKRRFAGTCLHVESSK